MLLASNSAWTLSVTATAVALRSKPVRSTEAVSVAADVSASAVALSRSWLSRTSSVAAPAGAARNPAAPAPEKPLSTTLSTNSVSAACSSTPVAPPSPVMDSPRSVTLAAGASTMMPAPENTETPADPRGRVDRHRLRHRHRAVAGRVQHDDLAARHGDRQRLGEGPARLEHRAVDRGVGAKSVRRDERALGDRRRVERGDAGRHGKQQGEAGTGRFHGCLHRVGVDVVVGGQARRHSFGSGCPGCRSPHCRAARCRRWCRAPGPDAEMPVPFPEIVLPERCAVEPPVRESPVPPSWTPMRCALIRAGLDGVRARRCRWSRCPRARCARARRPQVPAAAAHRRRRQGRGRCRRAARRAVRAAPALRPRWPCRCAPGPSRRCAPTNRARRRPGAKR